MIALSSPEESYDNILATKEWTVLYMCIHKTNSIPEKPPNVK